MHWCTPPWFPISNLVQRNVCVLTPPPLLSIGPPLLSDGDCLGECKGEVSVVEESLIPPEMLLAEDNGPVDPGWSPLKDQVSEDLRTWL